jgi:hypothetical protein
LEQVARSELFLHVDIVFVTVPAGQYIIDYRGAFRAQTALTVFAKPNGGSLGVIKTVHDPSFRS